LYLEIVVGDVRANIFDIRIKIRYLYLINRYTTLPPASFFVWAVRIICTKPETEWLIGLARIEKLLETPAILFDDRMCIDISSFFKITRSPTLAPVTNMIASCFENKRIDRDIDIER